jgi:hypothetical protein
VPDVDELAVMAVAVEVADAAFGIHELLCFDGGFEVFA